MAASVVRSEDLLGPFGAVLAGLWHAERLAAASIPSRVRRVTSDERRDGELGLVALDGVIDDLLGVEGVAGGVSSRWGWFPAAYVEMAESVAKLSGRHICEPSLTVGEWEQHRLAGVRGEVSWLIRDAVGLVRRAASLVASGGEAEVLALAVAPLCVARRQWQLILGWPSYRGPRPTAASGWYVLRVVELSDAEVDMLDLPDDAVEPAAGWPLSVEFLREARESRPDDVERSMRLLLDGTAGARFAVWEKESPSVKCPHAADEHALASDSSRGAGADAH
jgi:hypothetical protein